VSQNGGILDAKSGTSTMMWRRRMRRVSNKTHAALGKCRWRMVT
jgi:hypothetical protein